MTDASGGINFAYGAAQVALSSWAGAKDPGYAGKNYTGMISGIFSGVPCMAKVAATGAQLSPLRVGVSVIDGVFEATILGLSLSS